MATDVIMPQMGESIAEGTITKWMKNAGDTVARDEPLFEISTDKVDAEIPSPAAGTLLEILVASGQTVAVNTVVGRIGQADEKGAAPAPIEPEPVAEATSPAPSKPIRPMEPQESSEPSLDERIRSHSSPLVRKIAQDNDVRIHDVEGTGISGRVTKNDILSYIENRKTAGAVTVSRAIRSPETRPATARAEIFKGDRDEIVPMSVMRRKIAERMVDSKHTSAHVHTFFEIDYSSIARLREASKDAFFQANGTKLTYMPFLFQAVTAALKEYPDLNSSIDGDDIVYHRDINLGMAVALDWGLIVPVIKNADEKSILGLARAANDLAERARSKKLKPEEVAGGTFTVTNPGVFGSLMGTPIILQPQVAILGVGTIEKRPAVITDAQGNDSIGVRTMGYLALSFDHRLVDGAVADQFMARVKKILEEGKFSLA